MNQDWKQFLLQQGAAVENDIAVHFGDAAAELLAAQNGAIKCHPGHYGLLRASGEEAESFLQNLLSNDIRAVDASHVQLSSFNTPKGRMLATFLIWRDGADYLLQLPHSLCEPMRKKLSMYVLRSKVKITDASDERIQLGISGAQAADSLRKLFGELPQHDHEVVRRDDAALIQLGAQRWLLDATPQDAQALWSEIEAQAVGSACWDWLTIRAGIPVVLPQTQEQFVPQMANFEVIGGVNFKKGCYPGQEIVARMQYLGKPKRRMYLAHVDTNDDKGPQPGDELHSADMPDQASGMVVSAAEAPGGGHDLLAVVHIASHDAHPVHLGSLAGPRLQFLSPPYPLP